MHCRRVRKPHQPPCGVPGRRDLSDIYTDPGHVFAYPRTGQVRQPFAVCFHARPLSGSPGGDQVETSDARWFTTGDIGALPIRRSGSRV